MSIDPDKLDRRPIAARNLPIFQAMSHWLAERGVTPNAISVAGMISGIGAGVVLALNGLATSPWDRLAWIAGAILIQLRLLANMLDGMVAVESGKASPVGELYNEAPDRVSDAATLMGAGFAAGGAPVLGFSAACVAVFVAYVRALGKGAGAPQEFCGPMAKQQRMALVTAIALYQGLTPASWQPTWGQDGQFGPLAVGLLIIIVGGIATAIRRLLRISANLRKRDLGPGNP
jgi:phosphatidylglycerophosphate synthase